MPNITSNFLVDSDTICAISTAPGIGAIAVIRLSGDQAFAITNKMFSSQAEYQADSFAKKLKSHQALHGYIFDPKSLEKLDEVVVVAYMAPHSYTGEDVIEISCHGSPVIANEILRLCLSLGGRLAKPGEFTMRAFLAGRMDLTQAEAVLDLIQAKTTKQSKNALSALAGELGKSVSEVRDGLFSALSAVTAGIDFPDEVGEADTKQIAGVVDESILRLEKLAKTARSGRFLREGLKVSICGRPNAGKSSLLNQLLQFERAIVTDIPGTTRDSIEEILDLGGIPVILIDTAGIRATEDHVEKIGIERTEKALAESDLVLLTTDYLAGFGEAEEKILHTLQGKPFILLANKIDLADGKRTNHYPQDLDSCLAQLEISAKTGQGIDELTKVIQNWVFIDQPQMDIGASLNNRQAELADKAIAALQQVRETLGSGLPQDCLSVDLKASCDALSELSGQAVTEEVITKVFANFCIGK